MDSKYLSWKTSKLKFGVLLSQNYLQHEIIYFLNHYYTEGFYMVLLGINVLISFYVGSKILEKYRAKSILTNTFTDDDAEKKALVETKTNMDEQEIDHYLKVSTTSIGLISLSHFYPPLMLLSLGVFSYASLPIYKNAENSLFREQRIDNYLLNAIVNFTCLATGQYFVAALAALTYHFGGKTLAKAQSQSKEILTHVFDQQPRSVWVLEAYEEFTPERDSFREALGYYLYSIYQLSNKLPLDGGYETFPFLLFRCDNLVITRQQRFDRRYLFSSTTFNLINLVLSQDVDDE
jgi:hypothetical protein